MKRIITICVLVLGLFSSHIATASHIVGGEISYECLGNNQYKIILTVYRDCNSQNGQGGQTPFDDPARITFFTGDGNIYQTGPGQSIGVPLNMTPQTIQIDLSNPCLTPPTGICVDQAVYETTVTLPFNPLGYYVSYQRCCRNNSIANIGNPGQTGATFTIFISDLGQTSCNSSPTFNNFPPIVICNNEPIDFDHSASDANGDSLSYSFCAPSIGATPGSPSPNVATAPPYANVSFNFPYTASQPLGSNVSINPTTGFISGSPTALGQYVVGVCVDEYKNGVWVSSTRRDFQFNVVSCEANIVADILEDSIGADGGYIINSCNDSVITFQNESGQAQFIQGYRWEFNMNNGTVLTSTATNPTITFPGHGTYIGALIVNPNSTDCSDTAYVITNVNRSPVASYNYVYDSCVIGPINFTSTSFGVDAPINSWTWDFGDDSTMNIVSPSYQYQDAGTFTVDLTVIDTNGCEGSTQQNVTWAPTPIIDIIPSTASGCIPLEVLFENNSYPINGYSLFWTLGDGFTSTISDPVHSYQDTGLYTVTVRIESPLGCVAVDTFVDIINVRNSPNASFYTVYDSCDYGPVSFFNTSQEGDGAIIKWEWNFADGNSSLDTNVVYQYDSAGTYPSKLTVTDENDCIDTLIREINWYPAPVFDIGQSQYTGCEPYTVQIENTSYPINGYFLLWNLGDGYYSDQASPIHTYEEAGSYDLSLSIVSPTGCYAEQTFDELVVVNPNPAANFSYNPEEPTNFDPTVYFSDLSLDAVAWEWNFGDGGTAIEQNPVHTYGDTGMHVISLVVTHALGCQDTIEQIIDIKPDFTYYLPNAFTPNDDGKNDGYRGVGEMFAVTDFSMQIWSRWGEKVFDTQDPTQAWNGRKNNTGEMVQNGVYVCVAKLKGPRGKEYEYRTFATVIR
jgi:gliding motility-associated-like protein